MLLLSLGIGVFLGNLFSIENNINTVSSKTPTNQDGSSNKKKDSSEILDAKIQPDTAKGNYPVYQGHVFGSSIFDGITIAIKKTGKIWTPVEPKGSYRYTYFDNHQTCIALTYKKTNQESPHLYQIRSVNVHSKDGGSNAASMLKREISCLDFFDDVAKQAKEKPIFLLENKNKTIIIHLFTSCKIKKNQYLVTDMFVMYGASALTVTVCSHAKAMSMKNVFQTTKKKKMNAKNATQRIYKKDNIKRTLGIFYSFRLKNTT